MATGFKRSYAKKPPKPFKKPTGVYYIRQWIDGRDHWRSLGTKNKREAEERAYRLWYFEQNKEMREILELPSITLDEVWATHEDNDHYRLLAESTKRTRRVRWGKFVSWLAKRKIKNLGDVDTRICSQYLDEIGSESNKTYNNTRIDLSSIFNDTCRPMRLDNPMSGIQQKTVTRGDKASIPFRELTKDELSRIILQLPVSNTPYKEEWLLAVQIALCTGLRLKDVLSLNSSHIKDGCLELVPAKTLASKKAVRIKINSHLSKLLEGRDGDILPKLASGYEKNVGQFFIRFLRRIGIKDNDKGKAGFHSLRVNVATAADRQGIDLEAFGGVLGHSSKRQTEYYSKESKYIDLEFLGNIFVADL